MQKKKIAGYMSAKKKVDAGMPIRHACEATGISAMTYYKYKNMFGDQLTDTTIEVLPQDNKTGTTPATSSPMESYAAAKSELDKILQENAALAEQLKLRTELAKYAH